MRPIKRQPETLRWFHSLRDNQRAWAAFSLVCSRVSGILLFAFSVVVFAVNLPAQAASFQTLFQAALSPAGPLSTDVASPLHALGLSESGYVIINMVLLMAAAFASFLVSGLILWRKGDDRVALLGATMLLSVGVVGPTALTGAFGMLVPAWPWHVFGQCLIFIAVLSFPLFFLLFPSGHFVPRWTPWLLMGILPLAFLYAFFPRVLFSSSFSFVRSVALVGISLCLVVAQVYRYRHISSAIQRQQTKWVSFGVIGGLVINSLGIVSLWFLSLLHFATTTHAFFFTPVTTFLVLLGLYLLLVFGSQYLLASFFGPSNDVVLVVSTLIVAALFQPLRQRVQQIVDRRFYRSKYDATQILADFSKTLHQEVDLDQL